MKGFLRKWNEISLIKRIVCGLAMGAVLALLLPDIYVIGLLGTLFVGALKAIAPLLVFFLVIASLARAESGSWQYEPCGGAVSDRHLSGGADSGCGIVSVPGEYYAGSCSPRDMRRLPALARCWSPC